MEAPGMSLAHFLSAINTPMALIFIRNCQVRTALPSYNPSWVVCMLVKAMRPTVAQMFAISARHRYPATLDAS